MVRWAAPMSSLLSCCQSMTLATGTSSRVAELLSHQGGYKESDGVVQQIALQLRLYIEQSLYNKTLRHNDQGQITRGKTTAR